MTTFYTHDDLEFTLKEQISSTATTNINFTVTKKSDNNTAVTPNSNLKFLCIDHDNDKREYLYFPNGFTENSTGDITLASSGLLRGITEDGTSLASGTGKAHATGAKAYIVVGKFFINFVTAKLDGTDETGSTGFKVGDGTAADQRLYFVDDQGNPSYIGKDNSEGELVFSDDGTATTALNVATGHGSAANIDDHADVAAAVTDSMAQGDVYFADSTPAINRLPAGTANKVLTTQGAGADPTWETVDSLVGANLSEADTFFGSTDISASEAETLTDGSNADSLHTHDTILSRDDILEVVASDDVLASSTGTSNSTSSSYVKVKELTIGSDGVSGTYRIVFDMGLNTNAASGESRVYKNDVAFGTERTQSAQADQTYSEDLAFSPGDTIQIYAKVSGSITTTSIKNFYVKGTIQVAQSENHKIT